MTYKIKYAFTNHIGKVRENNEDNLWCQGKYLRQINKGMSAVQIGQMEQEEVPAFAVFDGMGGESQGEAAAFLAANTFHYFYEAMKEKKFPINMKEFLLRACKEMNRSVCGYAKENKIASMGTTLALLVFGKEYIYVCNLGDSRVYQTAGEQILQLSQDHVGNTGGMGKPPLTQYLGVPEEEMQLQPYLAKGGYHDKDRYLLCSDGLTDMLSEDEILTVISSREGLDECVEGLLEEALKRGGRDNITIIMCEVERDRNEWMKKFWGGGL